MIRLLRDLGAWKSVSTACSAVIAMAACAVSLDPMSNNGSLAPPTDAGLAGDDGQAGESSVGEGGTMGGGRSGAGGVVTSGGGDGEGGTVADGGGGSASGGGGAPSTAGAGTGPTDECPDDIAKTSPGACGCGFPDSDGDGDGTADCDDLCPDDELRIEPGGCGCNGVPEVPACATLEAALIHRYTFDTLGATTPDSVGSADATVFGAPVAVPGGITLGGVSGIL